jgi:long-chain acyl-CoA synthetase
LFSNLESENFIAMGEYMEPIWLKNYPKGVKTTIDVDQYRSIVDVFEESVHKFSSNIAFTNFKADLTYSNLNTLSRNFAAYLQNHLGLKKGDRIAIQMPNLLQFPVVLFGSLRAGLVVTNINPLYTEREMEHQLKDSGAETIIIVANFASKLQTIVKNTKVKNIIVTEVADLVPFPKSLLINSIVKYVKKMVPAYDLPQAKRLNQCLALGSQKEFNKVEIKPTDTAFLQYTGGTTGVAKGAELTQKNVVSNMLQIREWMSPLLKEGQETAISPLPMYHIFSLTVNCLAFMSYGARNVLITNPRDIPNYVKEIKNYKFTIMAGLNTLYNALLNNKDFHTVDFSHLKISVGGGMAMQKAVTERWKKVTGTNIVEGFGLTETSPVLCCNPVDGRDRVGTIGMPVPNTEIRIVDDSGKDVAAGESGELWARGPQVMKGYWNKPEETEKVMTSDGWFKTGDIAVMEADGFFKIVDRKKDMILVSGFNVYPNELEDVVAAHPKVLEVAAIGVLDEKCGEVPKLFVVKKDESLTIQELEAFCKEKLTGYKRPKFIEFLTELPKSNVGKILRKDLRDLEKKKNAKA